MTDDVPETPLWVHAMRNELDSMPDVDKVRVAAEWITLMTQELLTELSEKRKLLVATILARPGWNATRLAETVGARRSTIARLAEEGRRALREQLLYEGDVREVGKEEAGPGAAGAG